MALVPKIDPNKIFASNAPTQDKPAAFDNYEKGMDETRKNLGRPTIKQLNYLHQTADQKILWIHQNGGGLPYDASIEYAENAVTLKDGELQKKQGAGWAIPYLGKSNNLDDVPSKTTARTNLDVYSKIEVDNAISSAIPNDVPNATEIVAGKAKIATTAIAQAGTNDTDIITAKKLRAALNATGEAPMYACRAWVNFNGIGTVAINSSGNVSSITDNGIGDYTLNFLIPMTDEKYSLSTSPNEYDGGAPITASLRMVGTAPLLKTTSSVRVAAGYAFNSTHLDANAISIQVFR